MRGVRIDSGDLAALSKKVRRILDDGGLADVNIFVSGGLDEDSSRNWCAPARRSTASASARASPPPSDAPALDCAYKLQEYAGLPRRKRSTGKATWPGRKQVWRRYGADGRMAGDVLSLEDDQPGG